MDESKLRTIVVTGFGPFGIHIVNASWQAVKNLSETYSEDLKTLYNVKLITEEIPVHYNHVNDRIPQLWAEHKPCLMIHVGVSHLANCLTIESKAHSSGYNRVDVSQQCPKEDNSYCNALDTEINVEKLCEDINNSGICKACISNNAGRYLCEYIFYQSLCIQRNRTLFIHVPDSKIYPPSLTAQGLYFIICRLLESTLKD